MKKLSKGKLLLGIILTLFIIDTIVYYYRFGYPYNYDPFTTGVNTLIVGLFAPIVAMVIIVMIGIYIMKNWD